jgi:hypothetical protein
MKIDGVAGLEFPARKIRGEEQFSVSAHARSISSTNPVYFSTAAAEAAGYAARPLPPMLPAFFNTVEEADLLETLGISYGRTLIAGIEIEHGAVATERDLLIAQTRVCDAYEREGKDGRRRKFLILETEVRTDEGAEISRSKMTFIEVVD